MCGIAGILHAQSGQPVAETDLVCMGNAIAHRGPDDHGIWSSRNVGLTHRRLSIIGLSDGHQPIFNEDGSVAVVFNGEIYNYQEIRQRLKSRGHQFRTNTDTEVLVHLYEDLGDELVHELRGMFAFAIWDSNRQKLLLARDRIGLKPLYIYRDSEKLIFASELKPIHEHPDVELSLDVAALDSFLAYGVIPGSQCIFRECEKLPPAHVLCVDSNNLKTRARQYWKYEPTIETGLSVDEWQDRIRLKIDETVTSHLVSDVPVGAFLSGGVDSSVIVDSMGRLGCEQFKTFSIGFDDPKQSELPFARSVAQAVGSDHIEEVLKPNELLDLDELVCYYDEPFADSSAIPTLHVSRLASEHVKVVLSGDGGDEAFGGYSRYAHDLVEARYRRMLPSWFRRTVVTNLAALWPKADWLPRPLRAKTRLTNLALSPAQAYANTITINRLPQRHKVFTAGIQDKLKLHDPGSHVIRAYGTPPDELSGMIAADVQMLLPDAFLTKVDRASMAFGLEVRPPLVDHELLELTSSIPSELKIREGETKWILKSIYASRLPYKVTNRPKQGFELPVDQWLRGPLRETFNDLVFQRNSRLSDILQTSEVRRMYESHSSGVGQFGNSLWAILILASWHERYCSTSTLSLAS